MGSLDNDILAVVVIASLYVRSYDDMDLHTIDVNINKELTPDHYLTKNEISLGKKLDISYKNLNKI